MAPPPIQSRHRKPITYGRISRSNSANFKVFQDTVEGSNPNEEPRATVEIVPRRIRAAGLSLPHLPPMAEKSLLPSQFDSTRHMSDDYREDPFADPPTPTSQLSTGSANTKEAKQSVWPSLPGKVVLAEKSVNYPVLRNTSVAVTGDFTSPSNTGSAGAPPPRPHKIRHYEPGLEGQDFPYPLSPSKARSPISEDYFRRFSTRAAGKGVGKPPNTPPARSGIGQHGMTVGNPRAGTRVREEAGYVTKKTAKMGSSSPSTGHNSHDEGVTPKPLKKTFRGGVRKTLSPRYPVERVKKRRKGYEPAPTTAGYESGCESDGDSSVKDPFASGRDGGFEHGIFAGESSDYIAEIPKKHRSAQEPYGWETRAQHTQSLLARARGVDFTMKNTGTENKSRKFRYGAGSGDRDLGVDSDERGSPIAGAADSLMAYTSDSNESVSQGSVGQSTSKRQFRGQLRTHSKTNPKKPPGKPFPPGNKRNSKSQLLEPVGGADMDSTVGSGTEGSAADVVQNKPESISTVHTACDIRHRGVGGDKLVHSGGLDEDGLGSWDGRDSCKSSPDLLPVRANSRDATYPDALKTGGETEDFRQDNSIPDAGADKGTRSSASLGTRRMHGSGQGEKGKAKPQREKSLKSIPHNAKRKKNVGKAKTVKLEPKIACEDDDIDELQMDLPGMRI
ncbi:unnamed protein product [Tuber aestivum]|uniref:Uncharacterized protein n=1 Tax=Tuber aestivum TaxID=59557 RepID=A0A292Q3K3_9PEZI|nr:unnamed protein product [Tuber aestivum]